MRRPRALGLPSAVTVVTVAALAVVGLAGCALAPLTPAPARPPGLAQATKATTATVSPRARPTAPLAIAQATHEYPSPPAHEATHAGFADPVSAVVAFAEGYINWDAHSVARVMRELAAESVGQARSAMQLAGAQTAGDGELARAGVANRGTVEAVGPVAGHGDEYAVVTLERTTATDSTAYQGLAAAWHVAVARVTEEAPGRWVVSGWQPEN